jgi:hypothetical protein
MDLHGARGRTNREWLGEGNDAMKYESPNFRVLTLSLKETGEQTQLPAGDDQKLVAKEQIHISMPEK